MLGRIHGGIGPEEQALEIQKRSIGLESPVTCVMMSNLSD